MESLREHSYEFESRLWSWASYFIRVSFIFITVKWDNYNTKLFSILLLRIKRANICEVLNRMPGSIVIVL